MHYFLLVYFEKSQNLQWMHTFKMTCGKVQGMNTYTRHSSSFYLNPADFAQKAIRKKLHKHLQDAFVSKISPSEHIQWAEALKHNTCNTTNWHTPWHAHAIYLLVFCRWHTAQAVETRWTSQRANGEQTAKTDNEKSRALQKLTSRQTTFTFPSLGEKKKTAQFLPTGDWG